MDKSHVQPLYGVVLEHATARGFVSYQDVLEAHARLWPHAATASTDALLTRIPLPIEIIKVDGKSKS